MYESEDIFAEYSEMIFKYIMTLCKDEDLAQELTQETFYRAIKSSPKFDGTCKVSTWLCQIAKYVWYQELDKKNRKKTEVLNEDIISTKLSLEEKLCLKEEKMQLIKDVHALDDVSKEIVLLRITGAFSFKEIGEVFNKNENWARVTFYRAKQKILKGRLK